MSTYSVYEHKTLGNTAIKNGFSTAGLFFPLIWSLYHKIWWLAAVLFPWAMMAAAMDSILSNLGGSPAGAIGAQLLFFHIPAGLIFGFSGNGLLKSALLKKGYQHAQDLQAQSPEDALGQMASNATPVAPPQVAPSHGLAEQLSRLNDLKLQGALSEAEYQTAKAKMLA